MELLFLNENPLFDEGPVPRELPSIIIDYLKERDNDTWLCGGAFRSIEEREEPKDFDIFFKNEDAKEDFLKFIFCNGGFMLENGKYLLNCYHIDVVSSSYWESIFDVIDSFDFTCCMAGTNGKDAYYYFRFMSDIERRELVIHKPRYPMSTIRRINYYGTKGYAIQDASQIPVFIKMFFVPKEGVDEDIFMDGSA